MPSAQETAYRDRARRFIRPLQTLSLSALYRDTLPDDDLILLQVFQRHLVLVRGDFILHDGKTDEALAVHRQHGGRDTAFAEFLGLPLFRFPLPFRPDGLSPADHIA